MDKELSRRPVEGEDNDLPNIDSKPGKKAVFSAPGSDSEDEDLEELENEISDDFDEDEN
jgi:hypothetical protein